MTATVTFKYNDSIPSKPTTQTIPVDPIGYNHQFSMTWIASMLGYN